MKYSDFNLCKSLSGDEKCFRLQIYDDGIMKDVFHEHVPSTRINKDNAIEFLKVLLIRQSSLGDREVLRSFLNNWSGNPSRINLFSCNTEYPEPGVLRTYMSSSGMLSWLDEIVDKTVFRPSNSTVKNKY